MEACILFDSVEKSCNLDICGSEKLNSQTEVTRKELSPPASLAAVALPVCRQTLRTTNKALPFN